MSKIVDVVGDGMIIVIVLVYSIFKEGLRNIMVGVNFIEVKRGMDKVVEVIINEFKKVSKKVGGKEEII